jgi:hypothetical protein
MRWPRRRQPSALAPLVNPYEQLIGERLREAVLMLTADEAEAALAAMQKMDGRTITGTVIRQQTADETAEWLRSLA